MGEHTARRSAERASEDLARTRVVPERDCDDDIQAHEDHAFEPVGLPVLDGVVHDDDGEEHHDRFERVKEKGEGFADDPAQGDDKAEGERPCE